PEDLGMKPDGVVGGSTDVSSRRPPKREIMVVDREWASHRWSVADAVGTGRFWLLTATLALAVLTHQMLFVHQAAYLVDGGYDRMLAASVVGLIGLASIPSKIMWGIVCDRLGRERAFTLGTVALLVGIALLVLARVVPSPAILLLYVAVFAMGYAATPPILSTATADVFGGRSFGAIYGLVCIGQGVGSAFGAWVAGYIFDVSGSYAAAFVVGGLSAIAGSGCLWLAAPRMVRRVVRKA
ncbi:MAG TPA: MFS transporter, partial [Chloroflexota bacterium]|nr:MFS transporter [Chloroflexota bacterium]